MKVTVIIPSYNHENYVAQAINSVLDQTWAELDLLVIDDGSRDNSVAVIKKIRETRGGFRFIHDQGNKGLINSLNIGLALAQGDYFCELASDDFLPPDSIEKRCRFLMADPELVAIFADAFRVYGDKITSERLLDDKRRAMFGSEADPVALMISGVLPVFSTGMFRVETVRGLGGFSSSYKCYEDLEMPILLYLNGKTGYLDEPVIFRREHETNTSSTTSTIRIDKIVCYRRLLENPALAEYRNLLRYNLRRAYLALGRHLSKNNGGSHEELRIFQDGWGHVFRDVRLLYHLVKWKMQTK